MMAHDQALVGIESTWSGDVADNVSRTGHVNAPDLVGTREQIPLPVREAEHRHHVDRHVAAQVLDDRAYGRYLPTHRLDQLGLIPSIHKQTLRLGPARDAEGRACAS